MKAVFRQRGSKNRFTFTDTQTIPSPEKCSVVVKVTACGLSPVRETCSEKWLVKEKTTLVPAGRDVTGVVTVVGSDVTSVKVGDHIVGILPMTSDSTGCAEYCGIRECDLVKKPDMLRAVDAAGSIGDCVRAYTALHYLGQVSAGATVLVMDGASSCGYITIQLAHLWGAKVITTASSRNEYIFLERMQPPVAHIIEMGEKTKFLNASVMEETGGVGVDCIIDNGVRVFPNKEDMQATMTGELSPHTVPKKDDLLSCLGSCSKWVTSQPDLQLDPPDSLQLYMRGAGVCFLFDPVWTLTRSQHGRYQHILKDAVDKLDRNIIKPKIQRTVTLDETVKALETLSDVRIGKVVMKML